MNHRRLVLVLCGSVSAWISANILNNTGFAGRDSSDPVLEELPLHHCNRFSGKAANRISAAEKLRLLFRYRRGTVFGGCSSRTWC